MILATTALAAITLVSVSVYLYTRIKVFEDIAILAFLGLFLFLLAGITIR